MADVGCSEAMALLNAVFQTALIMNDGHEVYARLSAGDDPADVIAELGTKFGTLTKARPEVLSKVVGNWPPLQMEAVSTMVQWALSKLDTDERVTINWKGDDQYPETVTRFEVKGNQLKIEFLHPPTSQVA